MGRPAHEVIAELYMQQREWIKQRERARQRTRAHRQQIRALTAKLDATKLALLQARSEIAVLKRALGVARGEVVAFKPAVLQAQA